MARGNKNSRKTKDFLPGKHEVSPFTPARHLHVRLQQKGSCPQPRQPCTASLQALEGTRSVKARPQDKKTQTIQNAAARLPAALFRTAGGIVSRHFPHTRKQFGLQVLRLSMTLSPRPGGHSLSLAFCAENASLRCAAARLSAAPFRTAGGIVSRHFPHTRKQFGLQVLRLSMTLSPPSWGAFALARVLRGKRFAPLRGFLPRYSARPEG